MPDDPISSEPAAVPLTGDVSAVAAVIEIRIEEPLWLKALPYLDALAKEVCRDVLARVLVGTGEAGLEVSLVFADDAFVHALNASYRGKDKPTNVLSFPADTEDDRPLDKNGERLLGDIVLAFETTRSEAATQGKGLTDHVAHLIVHGVLHLLGHDHEDEDDAKHMEVLEVQILDGLGIRNPYLDSEDRELTADEGRAHV